MMIRVQGLAGLRDSVDERKIRSGQRQRGAFTVALGLFAMEQSQVS